MPDKSRRNQAGAATAVEGGSITSGRLKLFEIAIARRLAQGLAELLEG